MSLELPCHLSCQLEGHQGAIRSVRFNVAGEYCLTGGSDKSVRLWNPHSGFPIKTYMGHGQEVLDAVSSVGNTHLGSCGADKLVIYWDVATGAPVRKYRSHTGRVNCVEFNEEGTLLISGSYDATVRIFDCKSRRYEPVQTLTEAQDSVSSIAVSDHEIVVGSIDCRVRVYDIRMGQMHADCMPESVTSVSFTRDGQCVLASSLDSTLRLVDKNTGQVLCSYSGHENSKYSIENCLSSKDTHVISGSEDGRVCFWDLVEGKLVHTINCQKAKDDKVAVESLSYHPKQCCLLTTCGDVVKVWKGDDWKTAQDTGHIPGTEEKRDHPVLVGYVPDCPREMTLTKQFRKI